MRALFCFCKVILATLSVLLTGQFANAQVNDYPVTSGSSAFGASDVRFVSYFNGTGFIDKGNGNWVENGSGAVVINSYLEMERTQDTIRLFDTSKQKSILLHFGNKNIFSCPGNSCSNGEITLLGAMERYIGKDSKHIKNIQPPIKPDLSQPWTSNFGNIFWKPGYYETSDKTLDGQLYFSAQSNQYIIQGRWGRLNNGVNNIGGLATFIFNHDGKSFTGYYTNTNHPEQGQRDWTGQAIR